MTSTVSETGKTVPFWAAYKTDASVFDEMLDLSSQPRSGCAAVIEAMFSMPPAQFTEICARADRMFRRMGVTFNVYGAADGSERIFPFDPIPRVIDAETWATLEAGLIQRVRALNAFVADVYGDGCILSDEVVPRDLVQGCPQFRRAAVGIKPPLGNFVTVAGIDLVRGVDGRFYVLEDNVRTPSGVSYVIENRVVMTRLVPTLMRASRVRSVERYPADLLQCLMEMSPSGKSNPTIALLTPGPYNSAFFEHVFLSQQMGIELVEGVDLVCVDRKLYMKDVHGLRQIDVLYRRIDDDFLDPLVFRPDSMLGVPGLLAAYREGHITIANAIGTGVADDKSIYPYVPDMIRFYLGQSPMIGNVHTWMLRRPEDLKYVLDHLPELVVKEVHGAGGYGMLIGPAATKAEIDVFRKQIIATPERYIAQPTLALSTCPTFADRNLSPRHIDLRPFVLSGRDVTIVPGGLTRVALRQGSLVVNSSQGGGTKDTWVLET